MDLRRQLSVNKASEEMSEFDKAEEKLRKARYLARTVFPYFAGPLTAMSIKMTNEAVFPEPKEYEDDDGKIVQVPKPKFCAGEITDDNGREWWLHPTFGVDEQMRTYIHPMAVDSWIDEATLVSPSNPCKTCGKTHHHPLAYVAGVYIHEMWHPLRKHGRRARAHAPHNFNAKIWNVAADMEINDNIREFVKSTTMDRLCLPHGGQFPDTYKMEENLLAEEYYTLLMKKAEEQQQKRDQKGGGQGKPDPNGQKSKGKGKGKPQPGQGDSEGDGDGGPRMPEGGRCGSGADGQKKDYEDGDGQGQQQDRGPDGQGQQPNPGQGKDQNEGVGESEIDAMARRVAQDVLDSAAKNPGSVPNGLVRWAGELLGPPKYNWRQELTSLIRYSSNRYVAGHKTTTYSRLSRMSSTSDFAVILPTHKKPKPHIAVVIDTSGSMDQIALKLAMEETEGLCKILNAPITLIDVDTEARVTEVKSVRHALIKGGGGTDMRVGINKALESKKRPSLIIVMTDGYSPFDMPQPADTGVIVCLVGNNTSADYAMPWMRIVHVKEDSSSKQR